MAVFPGGYGWMGIYHMGGYGRIGVYRVKPPKHTAILTLADKIAILTSDILSNLSKDQYRIGLLCTAITFSRCHM